MAKSAKSSIALEWTNIHYLFLKPGAELPPYAGKKPYVAVVVVEADVTEEWRGIVSDWLVATDLTGTVCVELLVSLIFA